MARIKQGFLGNASGKLGNVVFARWRNLETARQYQPDIQDANTPNQQKQRTRMVALLNFLKPLNRTFIKFFNTPVSRGSTPWATAIRDNMKGVSPDGVFSLQNLKLGTPGFPAIPISSCDYNPYIDQIQIRLDLYINAALVEPYPYFGCSALGMYDAPPDVNRFDVRHLLQFFPGSYLFTNIYYEFSEQEFYSYWKDGILWFMMFARNQSENRYNPNANLSEPTAFSPRCIIDGFNTSVSENPVPTDAISWRYTQDGDVWYVDISIDYSKTTLDVPVNYTMQFSAVAFIRGRAVVTDTYDWNLGSNTFQIEIGSNGFDGSAIGLYAVYTNEGVQVSRFNRIYVDRGTTNKEYLLYDQLFDCNYTLPMSFTLDETETGFSGFIFELFNDFITLYEQGIIEYTTEALPVLQYTLLMGTAENGSVIVQNAFQTEGSTYYFTTGTTATLIVTPNEGYTFSGWTGDDASAVVPINETTFELDMSKNRQITPIFILSE